MHIESQSIKEKTRTVFQVRV